jgi:ketosteroid isomerase-like protein
MTQTPMDPVDRFLAAFATGDQALMATLVHPDFEVVQSNALPYGGRYRGIEGFFEFVGLFLRTWKIERFEMDRRFDEAGTEPGVQSVALMFHLVGSVVATGEPIDTTLLEHWILKDGMLLLTKPHWFEPPTQG